MSDVIVRGLTKSYGTVPVLRGVDLRVPAGSRTVVLGPSGCGKTTLLRLIAGFAQPDGGTIVVGGQVVAGAGVALPPERRGVGYVPQEGALFPHLTVAANVAFGLPGKDRQTGGRVETLLELVGLEPRYARRYPHELSGGEQQRVAVARALAPQPRVVLLDEPFASLDAALRDGTRRAVMDALTVAGATSVLVTHDQAEALSLADQVAVMRDGRVAQAGSPVEVYRRPVDLAAATFLGDAIVLPATACGGVADCALGSLSVRNPVPGTELPPDGEVQVLIRPEQITICGWDETANGRATVDAWVRDVTYFGKDATVRLELAPAGMPVTARVPGYALPSIGEQVRIRVCGEALAYPVASPPRACTQ